MADAVTNWQRARAHLTLRQLHLNAQRRQPPPTPGMPPPLSDDAIQNPDAYTRLAAERTARLERIDPYGYTEQQAVAEQAVTDKTNEPAPTQAPWNNGPGAQKLCLSDGQVLPSNEARRYLLIQNNGTLTVLFGSGIDPDDTTGIRIPPGGNYEVDSWLMTDAIYLRTVASGAPQSCVALEI